MKNIFKAIELLILAVILVLLALFGYWYARPNRASVNPAVVVETWDIAAITCITRIPI